MTRYHITLACAIVAAVCSVVCAAPHLEMTTSCRPTASTSLGVSINREVSSREPRSARAAIPETLHGSNLVTQTTALGGGYTNTADFLDAETSRTSTVSQQFPSSPVKTTNDSSIAFAKAGMHNQSTLTTDVVDTPHLILSPNLMRSKNDWKGGRIIMADDREESDRDKSVLQNLDGLPNCIVSLTKTPFSRIGSSSTSS